MGRPKSSKNKSVIKVCEKCKTRFTCRYKLGRFCSPPCSRDGYGTFGKKPVDPVERFWVNVKKTETCWLWQGTTREGYGRMHIGYKAISVHRLSWEIHKGKIPVGMYVCHTCDTPSCVNPDHLWIGTYAENNRDRSNKGRNNHVIGSKCPTAKLKERDIPQIIELRECGLSYQNIAKIYGVDTRAIWQIFIGKTWKQIFDKSAYSKNMQGDQNGTTWESTRSEGQTPQNDVVRASRNR